MKLLLYSWKANNEQILADNLSKMGFEVLWFCKECRHYTRDMELAMEMIPFIHSREVEAVVSFNYFPIVSMICSTCRIPYYAWVYDCPHFTLYAKQITLPCNHIGIFDREMVRRLEDYGVETVYDVPLSVDAAYFARLQNDLSSPLLNYATQQRTAPGSPFKPAAATAGLTEGVISLADTILCTGTFDKISPPPRCWNRGGHGSLNVTGGLRHSCNGYFYEVGYRLGIVGDTYNNDVALNKLAKAADLYGLTETSGVEIEEYMPEISDTDAVRSAIGHGTNNFTTVGLARYVTTIANSGTCYNLTLVDKIQNLNDDYVAENEAQVRNHIDMDQSYWDAIHTGMRQVVEAKRYYADLDVNVAGKTGTAQFFPIDQLVCLCTNHALFISYAPYEDPEISVTVRVAYGYTSDYSAQIARDVYAYYYGLKDESEIVTGTAGTLERGAINAD